jgi:anti-sigma regulatory factor (Ser/Thr protein kinase)
MAGIQAEVVAGFRHEALFYAGDEEFIARSLSLIRDSVAAGEPILVAVSKARIEALQAALDGQTQGVHFADMARLGQNPARIIPAWREFVAARGASRRPLRGIGEPIWPGRSDAELVECHQHETLLNLAFADAPAFWLICPYDTEALDAEVVAEAHRTHPFIVQGDAIERSDAYLRPGQGPGPFDGALPSPAGRFEEVAFGVEDVRELRGFVSEHARSAGLDADRTKDFVLAVSELATNSVVHGGGGGVVRFWREPDAVLCEVRDPGRFDEPLLGRRQPTTRHRDGRGLWLVNQLCDLVQMRSSPAGSVVRLHMSTD